MTGREEQDTPRGWVSSLLEEVAPGLNLGGNLEKMGRLQGVIAGCTWVRVQF